MNTQLTRGHGLLEEFLARQRTAMADRLIPESARDGRVLDIGCGSFPFFLSNTRFAEKFGIDKHPDMEKFAELGIRPRTCDFEKDGRIPFEDGTFDVVTMLAVIEHLEPSRVPPLWNEIYRVLKPGGRYIFTTPAAWSDKLLRFMAKMNLVSSEEIDEHKDCYTHAKIKSIAAKTVFSGSEIKLGYFEMFLNLWAVIIKL